MAFNLTQTTKNLSQQLNVEPVLILEIDGISLTFGTDIITKSWFFDQGETLDSGLFFDGVVEDESSRGYIQKQGTTSSLNSQVYIEEGGSGSVQKFNINLVDKNNEVSRILTPGVEVDDPLTRDANVYLGFRGGAHPSDSVRIFTGIIDSIKPAAGSVNVSIAHPDQLKRQDIFQQNSLTIDGDIADSDTTIPFDNDTFTPLEPTAIFKTYIVIGDEIIQYTGSTSSQLTGCIRGELNTIAVSHDDDTDAVSFYTLSGAPLTLALQIMMSGRDDSMASGSVQNFNQVSPTEFVQNAIFIEDLFFSDKNGIVGGELVTIAGAINGANDITSASIINIDTNETGTIYTLDTALITENDSTATFTIKSQFDVLPDGLGMKHSQVDVEQHLFLEEQYGNQLPEYLFYLKDTIKAKEFIAKQIYFPAGLYSLIRKARSSVQITVPPLNDGELVELTDANVLNPSELAPERTINKYFYNNITYKYGLDSLGDNYLAGNITLSARSSNRIKAGNSVLEIVSDGLRDNSATTTFIDRQSSRFTERFQFAAEKIMVKTNYKTIFNIEVGDAVLFGSTDLKVYDSKSGTRDFKPRMMEVVNRSFSTMGTNVPGTLTLLDTQFSSDARYGTVSPNSFIDSGSTTTSIKIKKSFSTGAFDVERAKWSSFIGETIRVRDEDFNFTENVTLLSFDPSDETRIIVTPALSVAPSVDYLLDLPPYDEGDSKMKSIHCFATPRVSVVSGSSGLIFDVSGLDIAKFFVGAFIRVHNEDFTVDSTPTLDDDDLEIIDITSNTITVNRDMGFTASSSELVSLIGFSSDSGLPYRFT